MTRYGWLLLVFWAASAAAQPVPNVLALETTWRTEQGALTTLSGWEHRSYVLTFVYSSCASTCPLTTQKLKRLDAALIKAGKPLDLVVVSLDPSRDTPDAVAAYRATHGLQKAARWHVLVGEPAQVRALSMLLGFRYSQNLETGVISHDNTIFLIGPSGEVQASMSSLDSSLGPFVAAVTGANQSMTP